MEGVFFLQLLTRVLCDHGRYTLLLSGLKVGAILTAPMMAEVVGYSVDNKEKTFEDTFMGMGVSVCALVVGLCAYCCLTACCSCLFGDRHRDTGQYASDKTEQDDEENDLNRGLNA